MCCSSQSCASPRLAVLGSPSFPLKSNGFRGFLNIFAVLLAGSLIDQARADDSVATAVQPIDWVSGGSEVNLGSVADLRIPVGYRFTAAKGARIYFDNLQRKAPEGLLGVLVPDLGGDGIALSFSEIGFVKDEDQSQLDADKILAEAKSRPGASRLKLDWVLKPTYDEATHSLEWAVRSEGRAATSSGVFHGLKLLCRRGVIEASSVQPISDFKELSPLKAIAKGIRLKEGEAYAAFQAGDKFASGGLAASVNATPMIEETAAAGGYSTFLIAAAVFVVALAVAGLLLARKSKTQMVEAEPAMAPTLAQVQAESAAAPETGLKQEAARAPVFAAARPAAANGSKPKPRKTEAPLPHLARNASNGDKKRRVFNYSKFYTEMVMQGPAPVIGVEPYSNGYEPEPRRNGSNGNSNGNGNGDHNDGARLEVTSAMISAHTELISSQRTLIEEQKRLIEEQARLIEEKSRVIAEKTQLLNRQSQLIDNNML